MLDRYLQVRTLSVVIIGDFNPLIFQPFWLSNKNLIREGEATSAKVEIMHGEIVRYELDWISIEITKSRCAFTTTKEPYFDPLKDLVVGIFKILNETPIKLFGFNHVYDLSLLSKEMYFNFGKSLTPLEYWNENMNEPRLSLLEIYEKERKDGQKGNRRVKISPSVDQTISFGVSININDHFELNLNGLKNDFIPMIEKNWNSSFDTSRLMVENILAKIIV